MDRSRWELPVSARANGSSGFAIVAALIIVTMSLVTLSASVAILSSSREQHVDDAQADQLRETLRVGLADSCERLRWGWPAFVGPIGLPSGNSTTRYHADVAALPSAPTAHSQKFTVLVTAESTSLENSLTAEVAVRPGGLPLGVSIGGDATLLAPFVVEGSGVYAGGVVNGREWLQFVSERDYGVEVPEDFVASPYWPIATAHVQASAESQDAIGQPLVSTPELIAALTAHSSNPCGALRDGRLDLAALPVQPPGGDATLPAGGVLIVLDATGLPGGLSIVGTRPRSASPLTLVVIGDAAVVDAEPAGVSGFQGEDAGYSGALVVTGTLIVKSGFELLGHLGAGTLDVCAPLTVRVASNWRESLPVGYRDVAIVATSE